MAAVTTVEAAMVAAETAVAVTAVAKTAVAEMVDAERTRGLPRVVCVVCEAVSEVLRRAVVAAAWMMHATAKASGGGGDVPAISNAIMPIMQVLEAKSQARRTCDSEHPCYAPMMYTTPKEK